MFFEWDKEKNRINKKKHKIDFMEAVKIFEDENRIERIDVKHSIYEERYITIGMVQQILTVIYTERSNETIRIISARYATKEEIDEYNKENFFRRS